MARYYYPTDKIRVTTLLPFDLYCITTTDGKRYPWQKTTNQTKKETALRSN